MLPAVAKASPKLASSVLKNLRKVLYSSHERARCKAAYALAAVVAAVPGIAP